MDSQDIKDLRDIITLAQENGLPQFAARHALSILAGAGPDPDLAPAVSLPKIRAVPYADARMHAKACKVCQVIAEVPPNTRIDIEAAILDDGVSAPGLVREFAKRGKMLSSSSIARHRAYIRDCG